MDDRQRARLSEYLTNLKALHLKMAAQIDAVEALLSDTSTPGQLAKMLLDHFCLQWQRSHGGKKYVVLNGAKYVMNLTKLARASPDLDDLKRRVDRYLRDRDDYYVQANHPLGLFIANVNKFGGSSDTETSLFQTPIDCNHQPPCRDDVAHTRRKIQDART